MAVIGLGREGKALARFLVRQGAWVTISDLKSSRELEEARRELAHLPLRYLLGGHSPQLLEAEAIFVSPGVPKDIPILREARRRGIPLESQTRLFLRLCPARTIGITGSSGKSTTTCLLGQMLEKAGFTTWVGGNIGRPLLEYVEAMAPQHWVVIELSSFQLEMVDSSPHLAAILNIAPDHLDRHASLAEYTEAKANILRFQGPFDWAVLGWEDAAAWGLAPHSQGHVAGFGLEEQEGNGSFVRKGEIVVRIEGNDEVICPTEQVKLRGEHNLRNVLAASLLARLAGADGASVAQAISEFEGLEHRLELVRELRGVRYFNDSIATSPARTLAGLASFSGSIVLLAGGRDKNLSLEELGAAIRQKVRLLILFGEAAKRLELATLGGATSGALPQIIQVADLAEAVEQAAERSRPGEVVLLSPASTSFDMYRDYAKRGEHFRELVGRL